MLDKQLSKDGKLPYQTPSLIEHGTIPELTHGNGGATVDAGIASA